MGRGADGLAMAGGDGSQALVAAIAAEHDLPYACIPSGTRNHFALDLGVDREDVVGALDAFVDGGERYVDLGEVNGRVFVNNVSLGVYAEAVSQEGYRESKLRTLLDTLTDTLGPEGEPARAALDRPRRAPSSAARRWCWSPTTPTCSGRPSAPAPARASTRACSASSTSTRRSRAAGEPAARWRELTAAELEVEADGPVPVGIDGEAIDAGAAAALPGPPGGAASAHRPQPPGRLALGRGPAALGALQALLRSSLAPAIALTQIQRTIMVVM